MFEFVIAWWVGATGWTVVSIVVIALCALYDEADRKALEEALEAEED